MIKNIFRTNKHKALSDKPKHFNPCSYCWRFTCKRCLVFYLVDFSLVLRSDPQMSKDFEALYSKVRGDDQEKIKVKKVNKKHVKYIDRNNQSVRKVES